MNGLIKNFKIYMNYLDDKSEQYYEVFIFDNDKNMYKYYKDTGGYCELDFSAICRDLEIYDFSASPIDKNKIGEILIPLECCKMGIITHECGHAVFQYMRKLNKGEMWKYIDKDNCWQGEEFYCEMLGELSKQFVDNLHKNN